MSDLSTSTSIDVYASAYDAHYTAHDYRRAAFGYAELIQRFPESPEAGHARAQMRNLLAALVPADRVFANQLSLILKEVENRETPRAGS